LIGGDSGPAHPGAVRHHDRFVQGGGLDPDHADGDFEDAYRANTAKTVAGGGDRRPGSKTSGLVVLLPGLKQVSPPPRAWCVRDLFAICSRSVRYRAQNRHQVGRFVSGKPG